MEVMEKLTAAETRRLRDVAQCRLDAARAKQATLKAKIGEYSAMAERGEVAGSQPMAVAAAEKGQADRDVKVAKEGLAAAEAALQSAKREADQHVFNTAIADGRDAQEQSVRLARELSLAYGRMWRAIEAAHEVINKFGRSNWR